MFNFLYDFFKNWGVLLTTLITFIILVSTCGIKGRINYLNERIDTLHNDVVNLKLKNNKLKLQLEKSDEKYYSNIDSLLDRKHYTLLKYEKKLDEQEKNLDEVKTIIIDSIN